MTLAYPETRGVGVPAARDRILVGGVDVTWLRDKPTPFPSGITLTEPLAYGSCSLNFPQINPCLESIAAAAPWAREGAPVVVQRVDDAGDVVATDYRGLVIARRASGNTLVLDVGGQVAGRLSLINRQPPVIRVVRDAAFWAYVSLTLVPGAELRDFPTTGIAFPDEGGTTELAWLQSVLSLAQDAEGNQWTLMPKAWGSSEWEFRLKDRTSVDCTIFADGTRVAIDLVDDAAEQPNTLFGTGVTPDGMRVRNSRWPGMIQAPAPPYPMAGGASFGVGTTDAHTISGDGITVLAWKLQSLNYYDVDLSRPADLYDAGIGAAVRRLRRELDMGSTTTMDPDVWDALFDVTAVHMSAEDARIVPMVQATEVRRYNLTANGSIRGRNPSFDPHALRVDRNVDGLDGLTKPQMIDWLRGLRARVGAKNWAGTIRLDKSAAWRGQWSAPDAATLQPDNPAAAAHVMPARDIRPGMNVWLPLFDGGTLVHVSQVAYDNDGMGVTLTVDTQARDALELGQVLARNAESRRNLRREWNASQRGKSVTTAGWDEWGGRLTMDVPCAADTWTVFPVPAGVRGQVNRVDVRTDNPAAFCMAVFGSKVTPKQLRRRLGNPFPLNADGETVWEEREEWLTDRGLLYAIGDAEQPGGYYPRKHTNDEGSTTSHPVTGRWRDDSPFPYQTGREPVLYVAIYPDRATKVKRGILLYKQEDDAN